MNKGILVSLAALAIAGATGCGSSAAENSDSAGAIQVKAPAPPGATACAANALRTSASPDDLVPKPGTYEYAVKGSRKVVGSNGEATPLPTSIQFIVTPERKYGNVRCFNVQRRYTAALADTATFSVRGGDVYLTRLDTQNGGEFISVTPEPPVLSLNGAEQQWSGEFQGPTSARYTAEIVGLKKLRVGGSSQQAVGIESETKFNGELDGSEKSVRWLSSRDNVVLMETVTQRRTFGVDRLEMSYTARFKSGPG
ncbi:MAG: hypothetical protein HYX29_04180 [Solirubrobacterales bacterium]|nr:hypothetical protein [Solirubrobacterales bacterium]